MCHPLYLLKGGGVCFVLGGKTYQVMVILYTEESGLFSVKITSIRVVIYTENPDVKVEIQ